MGCEKVQQAVQHAEEQAKQEAKTSLTELTAEAEKRFDEKMKAAETKARKELEQEVKEAEVTAWSAVEEKVDTARRVAEKDARLEARARRRVAGAAAKIAAKAACVAMEMAEAASFYVAPEWDPDAGFAVNAAAREYCVARWKSSQMAMGEGEGAGGNSGNERYPSLIRVDYALLRQATNDFNVATHLLGKGGCCKVFKASVYGQECAVKVSSE
jgi:hypothetical protein